MPIIIYEIVQKKREKYFNNKKKELLTDKQNAVGEDEETSNVHFTTIKRNEASP